MNASHTTVGLPPMLPNPETSLAWLPPVEAHQFEVARYIAVGTAGGWIWDILMGLGDEVKMFQKQSSRRLRFPDAVYILARIISGSFIFLALIFDVTEVDHCDLLLKAVGCVAIGAIALNSLLFLIRICAIFNDRQSVKILFTLLWLSASGCSVTTPFSLSAEHIGKTNFCLFSRVAPFGSAGIVGLAVHDTLVCAAVSLRLVLNARTLGELRPTRTCLSGEGRGRVAQVLLQGGLQYYFATVGFSIVSAVAILAPSVPVSYGNVLAVPNCLLVNAMASRVYRQLKLGLLTELLVTPASTSTPIQFSGQSLWARSTRSQKTQESRSLPTYTDSAPVIHLHSIDISQRSLDGVLKDIVVDV